MRVGILTFSFNNNFGALLQAYGLRRAVERFGHTVRFIKYIPSTHRTRWWKGWGLQSGKRIFSVMTGRMRFERFRHRYIPSTNLCITMRDLERAVEKFDAVIVGSDQVWNGHLGNDFEGKYFLNFVNGSECRRISYAACFGDTEQPPHIYKNSGPLLNRFDYLSVRNKMSAEIVYKITGNNAVVVVDPTMVHDFNELKGKIHKHGEYIAAYFLPHENIETGLKVLKRVKKILQLPIISINANLKTEDIDEVVLSAGPAEWIDFIRKAAFICTDSFHGTVFSVKFKKPFISWSTKVSEGFRGPARIQDFLETCGLQTRHVENADSTYLEDLVSTPIDYNAVAERLAPLILRSTSFLEKALNSNIGVKRD